MTMRSGSVLRRVAPTRATTSALRPSASRSADGDSQLTSVSISPSIAGKDCSVRLLISVRFVAMRAPYCQCPLVDQMAHVGPIAADKPMTGLSGSLRFGEPKGTKWPPLSTKCPQDGISADPASARDPHKYGPSRTSSGRPSRSWSRWPSRYASRPVTRWDRRRPHRLQRLVVGVRAGGRRGLLRQSVASQWPDAPVLGADRRGRVVVGPGAGGVDLVRIDPRPHRSVPLARRRRLPRHAGVHSSRIAAACRAGRRTRRSGSAASWTG